MAVRLTLRHVLQYAFTGLRNDSSHKDLQFSEMGRADRGGAILNGHHSISARFVLGRLLSCRGSRFGMNHDGLEDGGLGLLLRLHLSVTLWNRWEPVGRLSASALGSARRSSPPSSAALPVSSAWN